MPIGKLTRLLIHNKIEFEFDWLDDEYYLVLVLGNVEHIIHPSDHTKIAQVWQEIHDYWI